MGKCSYWGKVLFLFPVDPIMLIKQHNMLINIYNNTSVHVHSKREYHTLILSGGIFSDFES